MKIALFNIFKLIHLSLITGLIFISTTSFAEDQMIENLSQIKSLKDSQALTSVREFMASVHEDLETYYVINERNLKLPAKHTCVFKTKAEVVRIVTKSIMHTLKLYPDEELPVEEAVNDLKGYLRAETYEVCTFTRVVKDEKFEHSLFYSQSGTFYLRLDFVAPVN